MQSKIAKYVDLGKLSINADCNYSDRFIRTCLFDDANEIEVLILCHYLVMQQIIP